MHQNYRIVLFVSVAQNSTALDDGMISEQKLNTMWAETVMANLRYNPGTHLEGLMIIFVWNVRHDGQSTGRDFDQETPH